MEVFLTITTLVVNELNIEIKQIRCAAKITHYLRQKKMALTVKYLMY